MNGPAPRRAVLAAALDLAVVLAFVAIGRSVHTDGVTVAGMASTTWPLAAGAAAGWLAARAWRDPARLWPAGVAVWLAGVAVGMILRVVSGQGTAAAFVGVALAFLGLGLLGWRAAAALSRRARSRGRGAAAAGPPLS